MHSNAWRMLDFDTYIFVLVSDRFVRKLGSVYLWMLTMLYMTNTSLHWQPRHEPTVSTYSQSKQQQKSITPSTTQLWQQEKSHHLNIQWAGHAPHQWVCVDSIAYFVSHYALNKIAFRHQYWIAMKRHGNTFHIITSHHQYVSISIC